MKEVSFADVASTAGPGVTKRCRLYWLTNSTLVSSFSQRMIYMCKSKLGFFYVMHVQHMVLIYAVASTIVLMERIRNNMRIISFVILYATNVYHE